MAEEERRRRRFYELLQREYEKGNYVIAGGDFNQTFDTVPEDLYPL